MHAGSFTDGGRVYVLGGFAKVDTVSTLWSDVLVAEVGADGSIAAWRDAGKLPGPRSHFAAARDGAFVYLTGGIAADPFADPPSLREVWRARIGRDGALGEWTAMTPLPSGVATHASFVRDGWLYVAGGVGDKPEMLAAVLAAPIRNHALGAWRTIAQLPVARGHVHQMPLHGDRVYSVGGAVDFELRSSPAVHIGTFTR
jgi:hypothetical protein